VTGTAAILAAGLLDAPRSAAWSAPKAVGRRDYILAPGASLTGILTVIPVAFLALGLTATVLQMLVIGFKKGSLVSAEGKLLEGPHEGGTGQGTMDLVNVYFFCRGYGAGRSGIGRSGGWCRWRASRRWPGSFRLGSGAS
jgi:hypothetical protein